MRPNDLAAGVVTIMDATGKVIDRVPPEHFYKRQAAETRKAYSRLTPEERKERARRGALTRWGKRGVSSE